MKFGHRLLTSHFLLILIISYVEYLVEPVVLVSVVTEHLLPRLEVIQGIDCHNGAKHRVRREQSVPGQCDYELLSFFGSVIGSVSSSRSHNVRPCGLSLSKSLHYIGLRPLIVLA